MNNRKFSRLLFGTTLTLVMVAMAACSDDTLEVINQDEFNPIIADMDVVNNKILHILNIDESSTQRVEINTLDPIEIVLPVNSPLQMSAVTEGDKQYVEITPSAFFTEKVAVVPMYVAPKGNSKDGRNLLVVAHRNFDESMLNAAPARASADSPLLSSYSNYMGKGTFCFGELGNTTASVLLYDAIAQLDEKYVTVNSTLNQEFMAEHSEETSESSMHSVSVNLGIDFKKARRTHIGFQLLNGRLSKYTSDTKGSISGSFDLGITSTEKESLDFEYYMNLYSVRKSEVAIQMPLFEITDNNQSPDGTLLAITNSKFIEQIVNGDSDTFNTDEFFDTWGTDVITNAVFGGYCLYLYAREENAYEHTLGVEAGAEMKRSYPASDGKRWIDMYINNNSPYMEAGVDIDYKDENYNSATKAWTFYKVIGGNMTDNDASAWLEGFNDSAECEKWSLVSYRRLSSSALNPDEDDPDSEYNWDLYPVEKLGEDILGIYLSQVAGNMTPADSVAYNRVEAVVSKLADAKMDYLEKHQFTAAGRSPLVLADFMMKNGGNGHVEGEPTSFTAEDPRYPGKYRVYYPMMANKYNYYDEKGQTGYAVETTQNAYYNAILDTEDHYWYYALAHENDCDGIVDIKFVTEDEADDYYLKRGNNAGPGQSSATPNYVFIKFYDSGLNSSQKKITAVGLYDRDDGDFDPERIFASSGGSELKRNPLESEVNAWKEWWSTDASYVMTTWNEGFGSANVHIWPCMSTKALDINNFKGDNICHPKAWGE